MLRSSHAAALAAACGAILAGCNGSSTSSPSLPAAGATASPSPSPSPTASPSVSPNYTFAHPASSATFSPPSGGAVNSGPYQGVSLDAGWSGITATAPTTFTADLATGSGDISPAGFPLNPNGHVAIYVEFTATPAVSFTATPSLIFSVSSPATITGTLCSLYVLSGLNSSTPTWKPVFSSVAPSGSTVAFPSQSIAPNTVDIGNPSTGGQTYLSLACQ